MHIHTHIEIPFQLLEWLLKKKKELQQSMCEDMKKLGLSHTSDEILQHL